MKKEVFFRKSRFNSITGSRISSDIFKSDEDISDGLANRLADFAIKELSEIGFESFVSKSDIDVYTLNGDWPKKDRGYTVRFTCKRNGYIELSGILTKNGWPHLHHGYALGVER